MSSTKSGALPETSQATTLPVPPFYFNVSLEDTINDLLISPEVRDRAQKLEGRYLVVEDGRVIPLRKEAFSQPSQPQKTLYLSVKDNTRVFVRQHATPGKFGWVGPLWNRVIHFGDPLSLYDGQGYQYFITLREDTLESLTGISFLQNGHPTTAFSASSAGSRA